MISFSVIICTHAPHRERLARTLVGLKKQTFPPAQWELLIVDNASEPPLSPADFAAYSFPNFRLLRENTLGLTHARRTGLRAAIGEFALFVDDDNVLASDYLAQAFAAFSRLPQVGAIGGKSIPEFSTPLAPDDWRREFLPLLALRDLGDSELISGGLRPPASARNIYPDFAPIGAGLALRRAATNSWLTSSASSRLSDRRGAELSSAGDNDIVFSVLRSGLEVAYVPALTLTHLIPDLRLAPDYLARLNHGIQKSWMQLLATHDASPWPPISATGAHLRKLKAWFTHRVWTGRPANHIRWSGACGHFEGRIRTEAPPA